MSAAATPGIAIDARYLNGRPSGIARYSENLLGALAALGVEARWEVFARQGYEPPRALAAAMRFHFVPWAPLSAGTLWRMGRAIDSLGCDLAHAHCPVLPLRLRTPAVVTFHDWQPLSDPAFSSGRPAPARAAYNLFYRWAYPRAARMARALIHVSGATQAETLRYAPGAAARSHVALSGLEPFFLEPPAEAELAQNAARWPLPEGFLLAVGSSRPNKQWPALLQAFAGLRRARPSLALAAVISRDRFFPAIEELIDRLGVRSAVTLIERASDAELRALYSRARLFLLPSSHEGFGFPLLEAMAQGTPAVIGDSGSLPELAAGYAWPVPPGDAGALERQAAWLLDHPEESRARAAQGRLRAAQFSWASAARQTWRVYAGALGLPSSV